MSGPNGETLIVLPKPPHGAAYVQCPTCGLIGWKTDAEPMYCPDDLTLAVIIERVAPENIEPEKGTR